MSLALHSSIIDQIIGVGDDSRNGCENMIINFIKLSRLSGWDKQLRGLLLFSSENYTVFSEDTDNGSILVDVFNSIFDLLKSTVGVESGCSLIVFR